MMEKVIPERMTAEIEGDFVVLLIGMRVNHWWKVGKWLPTARAMRRMRNELDANPDCGCLGYFQTSMMLVQYWRSFDHLEEYARSKDREHWPAWIEFNKTVGRSRGDVGIWHETYLVRAGEYECVYSGMPRHGLAMASNIVPATGSRETARKRLRSHETADVG